MKAIRRILGSKGNTTIPYAIRKLLNMEAGDPISYSITENGNILITRLAPNMCRNRRPAGGRSGVTMVDVDKLLSVFERLSPVQQDETLAHIPLLCTEDSD